MSASASFTIRLCSKRIVIERNDVHSTSSEEDYFEDETIEQFGKPEPVARFVFRLMSREVRALEEMNCSEDKLEDADDDEDDGVFSEEDENHFELNGCRATLTSFERSWSTTSLDYDQGRKCLRDVLKWLPFQERVKCERVCTLWKDIVQDVNSTKQSALGLFGGNVNKIQNFCPQVAHRVFASDCVDLNYWTDLEQILIKVPNLKSLHIRCEGTSVFRKHGDAHLIGQLCPKLEHLSFVDDAHGVNIYDDVMNVIQSCDTIKHLQLRFPYKTSSVITDQLALESLIVKRALYHYNRNLEILSINVPLNQEHCDILSNYCKLRKLSLHGTTIPLQGLTTLLEEGDVRGKYLRCLSIVIDSQQQLELICKNMICLQTFHCVVNDEEKKLNLKCISLIGQLKNLRNLFLSCWTDLVVDDGLIGILMGCSQLTSLTVNADCSDISIKYIGNFCPFIERLELNNGQADLITNASITQSISNLDNLRFLMIYYCDIDDDALEHLFEHCKEIEHLSITYSTRLTETCLDHIVNYANDKPWERISVILPRSLLRFKSNALPLPRNLSLSFHK
ncbi:hypothetical protein HDE_11567 [Halotydeus destructor]|nr:hypothetical protein HDE_11567 [Halotydeus destructor]